ncbi:HDOD domain-containing protein [Bowmanella dokdonensis]|uniref:HDOD domain-containing protein n=1 Tax=Bowmanella dokdonensis TaxID=751969 RepID=A0A939IQ58_9ALTE|nr:HDOD domain-containing protein [Bowmanella dokdonensis]MBN7824131.1 HDOD domain-containing protein [Bowmanella dokdonensis]
MKASEVAKFASQSFALPDTCSRIRALLDDPAADSADIAEVIALDPSLSSKLLRLANSALFRFPAQINSISKAVNVIGGEALYNLALAETATTAFKHFSNEAINLKRFWQQSVFGGLLAKHMSKIVKVRGSDEYFVTGLLHQFSELVVATRAPELASKCEAYHEDALPWQTQREELGFTYAECSALILKKWQLPEQFAHVIANVHQDINARTGKDILIGHFAVRLALHMVDSRYSLSALLSPAGLKKLKLEADDIQDLMKFTRMDAHKLLALMNPELF